MEVEGETGNKRKGKFRSCRRKKRKGFHGKKAWEVRREAEENDRNDTSVESHVEPQPSTSKAQSEYDDFLDRTAPKNMSELKLMNSSFESFDRQEAVTTRSQSSSAEICVHEEAHGFKLQDAKLLSECFAVSAICSTSFKPETDERKKKKNPPKKRKSTVALPAPSSSSGLDIVFVVYLLYMWNL